MAFGTGLLGGGYFLEKATRVAGRLGSCFKGGQLALLAIKIVTLQKL